MSVDDWRGLYGESWSGEIIPDSFAHPAKFSRALIRQIYGHLFDEDLLREGDMVLDPFAGIGLGAYHALQKGLNWIGVELEQRFVDWGNENVALWQERYGPHLPKWGRAVLLQGDSRKLCGILADADALVSSPPYSAKTVHGNVGIDFDKLAEPDRAGHNCQPRIMADYGNSHGQLSTLPEGDLQAVVSSPPYSEGCRHTGGADPKPEHLQGGDYHGLGVHLVSSPPYRGNREDGGMTPGHLDDPGGKSQFRSGMSYGETDGQMAGMPQGEFEAVVSSPPYEEGLGHRGEDKHPERASHNSRLRNMNRYGGYDYDDVNQMGNLKGENFWSAARTIVEQCHAVLSPGAIAVWVVKAYVRNKKIVDFPNQWRQLCEACGFETLHQHRAWLVEERGAQWDLFGNLHERRVERKSFFRRLAESKGSPRIDYEIVWCMRRKP